MNSEIKVISIIVIVTILVIIGGLSLVADRDPRNTVTIQPDILVQDLTPTQGTIEAQISLVEFGDFACPACAMLHPQLKDALSAYPNNTKFALRLLPIHGAESYNSAIAAFAAKEQGKFFEYGDLLFEKQGQWVNKGAEQRDMFISYATELNLDITKFTATIDSPEFQSNVKSILDKDNSDAMQMGINSTPTVIVNGKTYFVGVNSSATIKSIIENELPAQNQASSTSQAQ